MRKEEEGERKTIARVIGKPSTMRDLDEDREEEEPVAPPTKTQKLMGDAIRTGAAPSKPKSAPKPSAQAQAPKPSAPKRSTRNISAAKKNKAPVPEAQEDNEPLVFRKFKSKIPDHSDDHLVAENMKEKKDASETLETD